MKLNREFTIEGDTIIQKIVFIVYIILLLFSAFYALLFYGLRPNLPFPWIMIDYVELILYISIPVLFFVAMVNVKKSLIYGMFPLIVVFICIFLIPPYSSKKHLEDDIKYCKKVISGEVKEKYLSVDFCKEIVEENNK